MARPAPRLGWAPLGVVGTTMGFFAGLLGTGGGPVAVPLLQRLCHLRIRESIAVSSAVMCLTSTLGAARKNMALDHLLEAADRPLEQSLMMAACMGPTAILGATYGAGLTHRLPLSAVRFAFICLATWAGLMMLGVIR